MTALQKQATDKIAAMTRDELIDLIDTFAGVGCVDETDTEALRFEVQHLMLRNIIPLSEILDT